MRVRMLGLGGVLLAILPLFGCMTDGFSDAPPVYETINVEKTTSTKSSVDVAIAPGGLTVDFPVSSAPGPVVAGLSFDFADGDAIDDRLAGKTATLRFGTLNTNTFEITTPDGKLTGTTTFVAAGACNLKVLTADVGVGSSPFIVNEVIALETLEPQISAKVSTQKVTMLSELLAAKAALQETAVAATDSVLRKAAVGTTAPLPINSSDYQLNDEEIQTRIDEVTATLKIKKLDGLLQSSTPKDVSAGEMADKGVALDIDADPETGEVKVNVAVGGIILDLSTITLQQDPALVVKTFKTEITEIVTKTNPGTGKVEQTQTIVISDGAGNTLANMTVVMATVSTVVNGKTETKTVATLTGTTQSGTTMNAAADVTKSTETVAGKVVETNVVNKTETQTLAGGEKKELTSTQASTVEKNSTTGVLILDATTVTNTATQTKSTGEATVVKTIQAKDITPDAATGGTKEVAAVVVTTTEKAVGGTAIKETVVDTKTTNTVSTNTSSGVQTVAKVETQATQVKNLTTNVVLAVTEKAITDTTTVTVNVASGITTQAKVVTETATVKDPLTLASVTITETAVSDTKTVTVQASTGTTTETQSIVKTDTAKDGAGTVTGITVANTSETKIAIVTATENTTTQVATTTTEVKDAVGTVIETTVAVQKVDTGVVTDPSTGVVTNVETATSTEIVKDATDTVISQTTETVVNTETKVSETVTVNTTETKPITGSITPTGGN